MEISYEYVLDPAPIAWLKRALVDDQCVGLVQRNSISRCGVAVGFAVGNQRMVWEFARIQQTSIVCAWCLACLC